jgi:hypothetical protein
LDHDSYILPSISFVVFGTGWLAQINKESQLGLQYSASIVQSSKLSAGQMKYLDVFFPFRNLLACSQKRREGERRGRKPRT